MKNLFLFFFLFILAVNPAYSQDDQGGGVGMGFRGFQVGVMQSDQTNHSTIMRNRRTGNVGIMTGTRRLVPQEYSTIQAAIDSSTHGDTILVSDGIYVENIRFRGKAIIVASLYLVDGDTSHIDQTIIDGSNPSHPDSASVVYFVEGEDTTSVLSGFTIKGGAGTPWTAPNQLLWRTGGGVFCVGALGATIVNNRITENRVSGENAAGGGVFFLQDQGFLILERNHIFGNCVSANPGVGIGGGAGILGSGVYVRIVENVIERDSVVAQDFAEGGGFHIGGNPILKFPLAEGVIRANVFRENIVDATDRGGVGGGILLYATSGIEVRDNLFEGNIAKSRNGWGEGGGIGIADTDVSGYGRKMLVGNQFVNNLASSQFGNGRGGAIELFLTLATISGNYFEQNTAQGGTALGGAINIDRSAFRLENNIFAGNTAVYGGAVHVSDTPQSGTDLDIINNTIVNNFASSTGGGIDVFGVQAIVVNSILWGNTPNQIALRGGGSIEVRYSNIQGGFPGEGNIDVSPFFADTVDYQLSDSSLCIGAGIDSIDIGGIWYYAPPTDMGGNPRPSPTGTMPDMGAWESLLGPVGIHTDEFEGMPTTYSLYQNYPNPFNPVTTISYSLPIKSQVELVIYNTLGEKVKQLVNGEKEAGSYSVELNAKGLPSGIYFYQFRSGSFVETKKMVLMK